MRNVGVVILSLVLPSASAVGQGSWAENLFETKATTHDFGSIPRGTQLYKRIELRNPYAVPLEISTRIGCHCVTVTPSSKVLEPRQKGYLDINMDARRFTGPKSVNIEFTVSHGAQYASSTTLQVTANSRADVVLNPGQVSFGAVPHGQKAAAKVIDVEYAGVLDWKVTEIAKYTAPLEATFKELYRRPGQVGYRVTVSLKPEAPVGVLKHELYLKTNDPASPVVPILVEATVQASLSVTPNPVSVGTLKLGESVTKLVVVSAKKEFKITAIEGQGEGVTAELPATAKAVQLVKITYQAGRTGALKQGLRIKTDQDQQAAVTVTVEGNVVP